MERNTGLIFSSHCNYPVTINLNCTNGSNQLKLVKFCMKPKIYEIFSYLVKKNFFAIKFNSPWWLTKNICKTKTHPVKLSGGPSCLINTSWEISKKNQPSTSCLTWISFREQGASQEIVALQNMKKGNHLLKQIICLIWTSGVRCQMSGVTFNYQTVRAS